jgi:hypothetical protein
MTDHILTHLPFYMLVIFPLGLTALAFGILYCGWRIGKSAKHDSEWQDGYDKGRRDGMIEVAKRYKEFKRGEFSERAVDAILSR